MIAADKPLRLASVLVVLGLCGCIDPKSGSVGSLPEDGGGTDSGDPGDSGDSTSTGSASADEGIPGGTAGGVFDACEDPDDIGRCGDQDADGIPLGQDNDPEHANPTQSDFDGDGIANSADLCPVVNETAPLGDSDKDGVGNECDSCRQTVAAYNEDEATLPAYMRVRNNPYQGDTDHDGIGDTCDNCVQVPNCEDFGPSNPHRVGDPIAYDDTTACNADLDDDMVGDACAATAGLGPEDDFDGDGIANLRDACPRIPLSTAIACTADGDCPDHQRCEISDGQCDHPDTDADDVGDICDTCPYVANPMQIMDGGEQADDPDGDFVGSACEADAGCEVASPRPMDFYEVAVEGSCCTVELIEGEDGGLIVARTGYPLLDPDRVQVRLDCSAAQEAAGDCRALPSILALTPGILHPPEGCEAALDGTAPQDNPRLSPADFDGDLDALWSHRCELPTGDADFDGFVDACDLCPLAFDPDNAVYVDDAGMVWPNAGKYCNGDYPLGCGE